MDRYKPFSPNSGAPQVPRSSEESNPDTDQQTWPPASNDGEEAAVDPQARMDYVKSVVPKRQPKKRWPWAAVIALVVLVAAGGGYWLAIHRSTNSTPKKSAPALVAPSSTPNSASSAHYVSNGKDLNLSFDYPSNWTVAPPTGGNTTDQTITLDSPLSPTTSASGSSVTAKVTILIRPASAQLTEFSSGNITAAQASTQIAYSKPTPSQHQYPDLTYIHEASSANPAGSFQEVLVSGVTQFNSGDSLSASSFSVDPVISASFYNCSKAACSGSSATPLSITNSTWQNAELFKQTLAVFESLQLN